MTEQIKEPKTELGKTVVSKPANHRPLPRAQAKPQCHLSIFNAIGIVAILATALHLSANTNYLFFRELTVGCSIIGMALLLKTLSKPAAEVSKTDAIDPRLN